ncbi:hypothetical protein CHE218_31060 [Microbacterium sp. che218]
MRRQAQSHERGDAQPDDLRGDDGTVALDDPLLFEVAHAPQARRGREADTIRELLVRETPVLLQFVQDPLVDAINTRHRADSAKTDDSRATFAIGCHRRIPTLSG